MGETREAPGEEARDLRLAEEGWEAKAETAVAGVTGAESWLLEEKEVSLRTSESSSVCAVTAEILRLLRSAAVATAVEVEVEASGDADAALLEGAAEERFKERALDGELVLARLRSTGIDESGDRYIQRPLRRGLKGTTRGGARVTRYAVQSEERRLTTSEQSRREAALHWVRLAQLAPKD